MATWKEYINELLSNQGNEESEYPIEIPFNKDESKRRYIRAHRRTNGPIDEQEMKRRQAYMESNFNDNATSNKGAKGYYQIKNNALSYYNTNTGNKFKHKQLYNHDINEKVRDWTMKKHFDSPVINNDWSGDSIAVAKAYAAYNMGRPALSNYLVDQRDNKGIDIYDSWDWLDGLPQQTRDYVNFIVRGQDISGNKNNSDYEKQKAKHK